MSQDRQRMNFFEPITSPAAAVSTKVTVDLRDIHAKYGLNLNSLTIVNQSGADIKIFMDGTEVQYLVKDNGSWNFDHQSDLIYSFLEYENQSAVIAIAEGEIKIYVGRTGK